MTDTNQEPTMEEILASIRRIISEDDAPQDEAAAASAPEPEPAAEAEPAPQPVAEVHAEPDDEVLDLTDRVETVAEAPAAPPVESVGDLDVYRQAEPAPAPAPRAPQAAEPAWADEEPETLVSAPAARSAASSFDQLHSSLLMPKDGRTLEDVVQELLRPLLKAWLDENLPAIVQAKVDAELERIARSRVR